MEDERIINLYFERNENAVSETKQKYKSLCCTYLNDDSELTLHIDGSAAGIQTAEKIKRETLEFQKWNDAEDDPAVIEKIPFLTLNEVKSAPAKAEAKYEQKNGISFYHTEKDSGEASLYFPMDIKNEDFDYVQLMHYFLQDQKEKVGLNFFSMLSPLGNSGYQSGAFKPQDNITRAEFAAILAQFMFDEHSGNSMLYSGMNETDWFYMPVSKMIESGYIAGYDDNTVRPNEPVTRAEAVTILNRMLNLEYSETKENPFTDVAVSHWAYKEIMAAVHEF